MTTRICGGCSNTTDRYNSKCQQCGTQIPAEKWKARLKELKAEESEAPTDEPHPLDESLGNIHEISLSLAFQGHHDAAMELAKAHQTIQQYVIEMETKMEMIKAPLPYRIAVLCAECEGANPTCDHTALRERLQLLVNPVPNKVVVYTSGEVNAEDIRKNCELQEPYGFDTLEGMREQDKTVFLDPKDMDQETFDKLKYYRITIEEVPCPE